MSVRFIEVGEAYAVFGLSWRPIDDIDREKAELRLLVKDFDASFQVRVSGGSSHATEVLYGLLPKAELQEHGFKKGKTAFLSPAILLATVPNVSPNAIWAHRSGDRAYMAVLEDGLPYPGGDFCGTPEEVAQACESILANHSGRFTFYGNVHAQAIEISLEDLVEEGNAKAATMLAASRGIDGRLMFAGAIVAAMCAAYGYMQYRDQQEEAARLAARKNKQSPEQLYAKSLAIALTTAGSPVSEVTDALIQSTGMRGRKQELLMGGWQLKDITCDVAACLFQWANVGGNNISLRDALQRNDIDYSLDGTTARYSALHPSKVAVALDARRLPSMHIFKEQVGSFSQDLRLLGVTASFGPESIFGADPTIAPSAIKSPVKAGTFSYQGKLALLEDIMRRLPQNMTLKSAVLTTGLDAKFTLEGTYYVKD